MWRPIWKVNIRLLYLLSLKFRKLILNSTSSINHRNPFLVENLYPNSAIYYLI